jgi:hypothetical protein
MGNQSLGMVVHSSPPATVVITSRTSNTHQLWGSSNHLWTQAVPSPHFVTHSSLFSLRSPASQKDSIGWCEAEPEMGILVQMIYSWGALRRLWKNFNRTKEKILKQECHFNWRIAVTKSTRNPMNCSTEARRIGGSTSIVTGWRLQRG